MMSARATPPFSQVVGIVIGMAAGTIAYGVFKDAPAIETASAVWNQTMGALAVWVFPRILK